MGIQNKLAKMTPGSPSLKPGVGGIPELTASDVAAAMGYAEGRVPNDRIGIHLVLAKYTDDNSSIYILEKTAARMAWMLWFDHDLKGYLSRSIIDRVSKLAIAEYCESGRFTGADAQVLAKLARVDRGEWRHNYSKIYSRLLDTFSKLENPVLRLVYQYLTAK